MKWNNQKHQEKYRSQIGVVRAKIAAQEAPGKKESTYNTKKRETDKKSLPLVMKPSTIFSQNAIIRSLQKKSCH